MCDFADVCDIMPAAGQIADLPRLVAALKHVGRSGGFGEFLVIESLVSRGARPVLLQLQAADWMQVMQGGGGLSEKVLQLPAVQQMTADQVGQLLQISANSWDADALELLATLPAAQQLAPNVMAKLLLTLLQRPPANTRLYSYGSFRFEVWEALLRLPPAQQLSDGVLQQIIDTAAEGGFGREIRSLCLLPQAAELQCGLSSEQVVCGILAAFRGERELDGEDAKMLMQQAGMQGLCVQHLADLALQVLRLPHSYDQEVQEVEVEGCMVPSWVWLLDALLQLPAAQQLGSRDVAQLIQALVLRWQAASTPINAKHLLCLTELPAAREVSVDQLLQMLTELGQSLKKDSAWNVLQRLPAWQRMTAADLVRVLKLCLGQHLAKYRASSALCAQVSEVLTQHPASGQLRGRCG